MTGENTRVLVVDDEEIVRESLSGWLHEDGFQVSTAADGRIAVEKMKGERWHVMLVDLGRNDLGRIAAIGSVQVNQYMSVDPSTRGRMEPGEKQYTTNFEIGGPLDGSAIGVVVEGDRALLRTAQRAQRGEAAEAVAERLQLPREKLVLDMSDLGNTAGATIPLALERARPRMRRGERVLVTTFGAGATWGCQLYEVMA